MAEQTDRAFGVFFFCNVCSKKRDWKYKIFRDVCPECRNPMDIHTTEKVAIVDYHINPRKRTDFAKVIRDRREEKFRFLIFIHGYGKNTGGECMTKERLHDYLADTEGWQHVSWVPGESMKNEKPWNEVGEMYEKYKTNRGVTLLFYKPILERK